ncbi:hypothetical protein Q9R32_17065 [Actinotalea sp. AC32]|nr:hypothetical protein [Actinotalea sp. AC32]
MLSSYLLTGLLLLGGAAALTIELGRPVEKRNVGTAAGLVIAAAGQATGAKLARDGARSQTRTLCRQVDAGLRRYETAIAQLEEQRHQMQRFEDLHRRAPDDAPAEQQYAAAIEAVRSRWDTVVTMRDALLETIAEATAELPDDVRAALARLRDEVSAGSAAISSVTPVSEPARAAFLDAAREHAGVTLR